MLGALGAHALRDTLGVRGSAGAWQTATIYHLAHTLGCLALVAWAGGEPKRAQRLHRVVVLWLVGCLLFAGSIYALALGGPGFFGPFTPLGGVAFLAGWILLGREAGTLNAAR